MNGQRKNVCVVIWDLKIDLDFILALLGMLFLSGLSVNAHDTETQYLDKSMNIRLRLTMVARNFSPRCTAFKSEIFNESKGFHHKTQCILVIV